MAEPLDLETIVERYTLLPGATNEGQIIYGDILRLIAEVTRLRALVAAERPALFRRGDFKLHSGATTNWKIDCDALTDEDWAALADMAVDTLGHFRYSGVEGVPTGGLKFAAVLRERLTLQPDAPLLLADDVLTTGASMEEQRAGREARGLVAFARGQCPPWVRAIFTMQPAEPPERELLRRLVEACRTWDAPHVSNNPRDWLSWDDTVGAVLTDVEAFLAGQPAPGHPAVEQE